jgi:hypothetical protein
MDLNRHGSSIDAEQRRRRDASEHGPSSSFSRLHRDRFVGGPWTCRANGFNRGVACFGGAGQLEAPDEP